MSQVTSTRVLLLGVENADSSVTGVTSGTSQWIQCFDQGLLTIYLRSVGTTSGGTVLIEEADWGPLETPYSGTPSQMQSIAASSFTGGVQLAYHPSDSSFGWVRVRISSPITGGGTILASLRSRGKM